MRLQQDYLQRTNMDEHKKQFLINMYNQMFNDINRHITLAWQSITTFVGTFAILTLAEKQVISKDIATSIIIIVCSWFLAHTLDAAYWYNRNLVIIANIEKLFLDKEDLRNVHYYFGKHRPSNKMIFNLFIHFLFGTLLGILILIYHILTVIYPIIIFKERLKLLNILPYILLILSFIFLYNLKKKRNKHYKEMLINSPGLQIDTTNIKYGGGHGYKESKQKE